jgi:glycosyltransferase involved in cell wall biosynthesis
MKRLRIAYLVTGLTGGGAETMLFHLLRGLDRERFEPTVISLMDRGKLGGAIEALGVPVETVGLLQGGVSLGAFARLVKLTRAARPDLIQGWMYHSNLAAQLAGRFSRTPVCWCIQNSFHSFAAEKPLTRLTIRVTARISRLPKKIVFVSHASRAQHERLGFAAERGCVIPNGVDPDLFRPSEEARKGIREEMHLSPETPLIGLMGRYHPQKDHANFLRAAVLLSERRRGVHFVLAGAGVDEKNAALRVPAPGGRLHLLGERDDMPRLTAALDIATSSSSYGEALSLAVAEAMACGVPCVVTEVGDSALLVGKTGVVAPPADAGALARGWESLLAAGAEARRELGGAARRRVEEHYSVAGIVKSYQEMYLSLN